VSATAATLEGGAAIPKVTHAFLAAGAFGVALAMSLAAAAEEQQVA